MTILLIGESRLVAQDFVGNCEDWDIVPYLYNDSVSKQSEICLWKNYWYNTDGTTESFFPDTLVVCLHLVPNTVLWEKEVSGMGSFHVKSQLLFKLGESKDSYNMVNSKYSEPIMLFDSVVDFESIFAYLNQVNVGYINIAVSKIPMKEILKTLNVFINEWGESVLWNNGVPLKLNQVIILTQIFESGGNPCRRFEFSLPVNGPYCNDG